MVRVHQAQNVFVSVAVLHQKAKGFACIPGRDDDFSSHAGNVGALYIYVPVDIYNGDKTGLFSRMLPNHTLAVEQVTTAASRASSAFQFCFA